MSLQLQKPASTLSRFGLVAIAVLVAAAMLFLFVGSMLGTSDMSTEGPGGEIILFEKDSLGLNILFLLLMLSLGVGTILLVSRFGWLRHASAPRLSWGLGLWVFAAGSLWILMSMSSPTHDSLIVTRAGVAAALGDLSYLDAVYFVRFPFQAGYVLWTEIWARLFGLTHDAYLFLEFVNVLCLAFGEMALVRLCERLFHNRKVTFATALALALFVQPMIFCAFLYGTMPGFCFAAWSMLLFVRYLQTDRWRFMVGAGILLAISVSLKLNNMILLVAMVIILLCHLLRGQYLKRAASVVILCVLVLVLKNVGMWQYELRTEKDFGRGIPMLSWMAMGLNDAVAAPGWYSYEYTVGNFTAVEGDYDAAAENSKAEIKERVEFYLHNPAEAKDFFSKKILSQWNEPTYQSVWNNQVRGQYMEKFGVAAYVCGEGEYKTKAVLDLGIQFVFFGMLAAAVALVIRGVRKSSPETDRPDECALWLIPLTVLGGFLYHALFEGKSQYVITYMTYMVPFAVWGVYEIVRLGKAVYGKVKGRLAK